MPKDSGQPRFGVDLAPNDAKAAIELAKRRQGHNLAWIPKVLRGLEGVKSA